MRVPAPACHRLAGSRHLLALLVLLAVPTLSGCAVVTVAGAAAGAAISVTGAVISTGVRVTGAAVEAGIDAVSDDDED
ncbi:MAG TPA: hypothetical protein VNO84_09275 [Burkholderiaceae bacterium]|nr:hypothetical protein [Burkholderiaceae bacterium]